jgi:hypothetical protein
VGCGEVTDDEDFGFGLWDGFAGAGDGMVGEVRGEAGVAVDRRCLWLEQGRAVRQHESAGGHGRWQQTVAVSGCGQRWRRVQLWQQEGMKAAEENWPRLKMIGRKNCVCQSCN